MNLDATTREAIRGTIPDLRAFAVSLSADPGRADDLVQETLTRAVADVGCSGGPDMKARLFTILRNVFHSSRRNERMAEGADGGQGEPSALSSDPDGRGTFKDLRAALATLPDHNREALILVGASGLSCEEAADICGCAVGTIKSRLNRAQAQMEELMAANGGARARPEPREAFPRGARHGHPPARDQWGASISRFR